MDPIFSYRNPEAAPGAPTAPSSGQTGGADAPVQGLAVAIQPNISVRGRPTEAGSNALAGYVALEDATLVRRLRSAGAYLHGSTHMSEFGLGLANSRAGSALRRADDGSGTYRPVDAELIMDFMGESRLAAARVGVCGFKPSYGLVSRYGLIGLIPSMECCGVLAGSPRTIREILRTIAGQDGLDYSLPDEALPDLSPQTVEPSVTSLGVVAEARDALPAEQARQFCAALAGLRATGCAVRDVSLPEFPLFPLVHRIVGSVEASSAAGRYDSVRYGPRAPGAKNWNEMYLLSRGAAFGTLLKSYLIQGAYFQFERYAAFEDACRIRNRLIVSMRRLTEEVDFLVLPAPVAAIETDDPDSLGGLYAQFASMLFANVTGQPALYLPPAAGAAGGGLQLAGPRLSDARLLALGDLLLTSQGGE